MTDKSLDGLLGFLDWTAEKGLMAKNTVNGRKAAVSGVLGVLDPEEKGDITVVDLDSVMSRFINLQGKKYNTSSLNVYKSRTNASISDFRKWLGDPLAFKPMANRSEKKPSNKNTKPNKSNGESARAESGHNYGAGPTVHPASANVLPIQIRENLIVRVLGLPFDLTASEAERIANIVKAMAMPSV
jgi:hypothetical protein